MNLKKISLVLIVLFSTSLFASDTGKDIFDRYCTACHSPSMSPIFGSPAVHDLNAWKERKDLAFSKAVEADSSLKSAVGAQKEEISLRELVKSAVAGTDKGMPPKGTCGDCTDDELKAVIKFMSSSE